jgi:hypothetical protein
MPARSGVLLPTTILVLGLAQIGLVILAFARVVDPGWFTFDVVAILSGLGMSSVAFALAVQLRWRRPEFVRFAWLGVLAGFLISAVWLSLPGGTFYTDDLVRIAIVLAADIALSVALVASVRLASGRDMFPGLVFMAVFTSVLTALEILSVAWVTIETDAGFMPTLVLSGSVIFTWFVFALWEILLGASLLHDARSSSAELATRR